MKKASVDIITQQDTITHWPRDEREAFNIFKEFTEMPNSGEFPVFGLSMSAPDKEKITTACLTVDRLPNGFAIEVTAPRYLCGLIPFFPMIYQTIDRPPFSPSPISTTTSSGTPRKNQIPSSQ